MAIELAGQLVDLIVLGRQQDQGVVRADARIAGLPLGLCGLRARAG